MKYEIREYNDEQGISPFASWFNKLDAAAAARVDRYIRRIENGNFGNSKAVGDRVQELKIDFGRDTGFITAETDTDSSSCWLAGRNGNSPLI